MSAPVLAFTNRKCRSDDLDQSIVRLRRVTPAMIPVAAKTIDYLIDYYLKWTSPPQPGNIGKPVITIDVDDREGA
jgi:hypothetical protein